MAQNPILLRIEKFDSSVTRMKEYIRESLETMDNIVKFHEQDKNADAVEADLCRRHAKKMRVIQDLLDDLSFTAIRPMTLAEAVAVLLPLVSEAELASPADLHSAMSRYGTADPAATPDENETPPENAPSFENSDKIPRSDDRHVPEFHKLDKSTHPFKV